MPGKFIYLRQKQTACTKRQGLSKENMRLTHFFFRLYREGSQRDLENAVAKGRMAAFQVMGQTFRAVQGGHQAGGKGRPPFPPMELRRLVVFHVQQLILSIGL
ncbi:hypothetical protein [Neomoorella humiferrea]|uniref:hypothetical protein n=1 Tax=Neomoorella humiferrea TaxID=676965 RepID=UPI0030D0CA8F